MCSTPATKVRLLVLNVLAKSVGGACPVYTVLPIIAGQLSGYPLLALVLGGVVYGLGLFAFGRMGIKRKPRLQGP